MKALRVAAGVALYSFRDSVRDRFFALFAVFAVAAVYASVLAGVMAVDQEGRVLTDIGLLLIELTALAYSLYCASTSLLREAETKTIYLVFSRPVPRWAYLAGKVAGALLTAAFMLLVMGALHLLLLRLRGFGVPACYAQALFGSFLKLAVIVSAAFCVSLFSTSAVSTLVISGFLWTAGHFVPETRFLADRAAGLSGYALKAGLLLVPNLQLFNARDAAGTACFQAGPALGAAAGWVLAAYLASLWLLSRKEF